MERKGAKLFIENLHPTTTNEDLENFFTEIGVLRNSFVVTEKGSKKCKGIGFVQFSIGQDADKAIEELNGKKLKGRNIKISYANKKKGSKIVESIIKNNVDDEKKIKINLENKKISCRVLVIKGLKQNTTEDWVKATCKHFGTIDKIVYPVVNTDTPKNEDFTAHVLFSTIESAVGAYKELNQKDFRNKNISITIFNSNYLKKFRLVIRNLSFNCTKDDVEVEFSKFGLLYDVYIPSGTKRGNGNPGFCFVNYCNDNDVKKAIQMGNKLTIKDRKNCCRFCCFKRKV